MRSLEKTILIALPALFFLDYVNEVQSIYVKTILLHNVIKALTDRKTLLESKTHFELDPAESRGVEGEARDPSNTVTLVATARQE